MVIVKRADSIQFESKDLPEWTHASTKLFNDGNSIMTQRHRDNTYLYEKTQQKGKYIQYCKRKGHPEDDGLYEMLKDKIDAGVYDPLPVHTIQQILRRLVSSWVSHYKGWKVWFEEFKENPKKFPVKTKKLPDGTIINMKKIGGYWLYEGEPRPPKQKHVNDEHILIFTTKQCKIKDGFVRFPPRSSIGHLKIKTRLPDDIDLCEIRIIPLKTKCMYKCEVVYNKEVEEIKEIDNESSSLRILALDPNTNNLFVGANNFGDQPIIFGGRIAKSMNHYYNRELARLRSVYDKTGIKCGNKMNHLNDKRDNKFNDFAHKITNQIRDYALEKNVDVVVFGKNDEWKQGVNIGKVNNQNFVQIPFAKIISIAQYKLEEVGIPVILQEESHTSKCSFLDLESVEHHDKYVGRRGASTKDKPRYFKTSSGVKIPANRGLFRSSQGQIIHSDVNGALNTMRKAFPNAFADVIQDVWLHPRRYYI